MKIRKGQVDLPQAMFIVSDKQLKAEKIRHLKELGFKPDGASWTNGSARIRNTAIEDQDTPLRVFRHIVEQKIKAAEEKKALASIRTPEAKKKKKSTSRPAAKKPTLDKVDPETGRIRVDAMDYRVPGSFESGKRR